MNPKAYSYIRFSSPEQSKGDSKRRQREAAVKYASENKLELVLDSEYQFFDAGISAYKGRNATHEGKLRRFYDYVKAGDIASGSYLLVESLDRLSREEVLVALPRFMDLLNEGINVVTLSDGIKYTKGADVPELIMSIVHMSRAHLESKIKGERVSKAWRNKQTLARSQNQPLGKVCPYWLTFEDGKYSVDEEKAAVVRKIFQMTIEGHGQTAVVKHLNTTVTPVFGSPNRNKSRLWGNSTIAKILSNRSVLGEYQPMIVVSGKRIPNGDPIQNYYPAIITEETFYTAMQARRQRRLSKDTKTPSNFNVWSKLISCSKCLSPMHLVNKGSGRKGFKYLRCHSAAKGMCPAKMIRLDNAELAFREALAMFNSLPLVSPSGKEKNNKIRLLEGKILSIKDDLLEIEKSMIESPSLTLARAASAKENELDECKNALDLEKSNLTKTTIFNKSEFFENLDLSSYEGRSAANSYLRNLNVTVRATNNSFESLFVVFTTEVAATARFAIWVSDDKKIKLTPLTPDMTIPIINQGELQNARMVKDTIKHLPDQILETQGNGRAEISINPKKLEVIEWESESKRINNKLLRSVGLEPRE